MTESLRIRELTESDFAGLRDEWADLLARSDADPLFMSWPWQWLWWKHHCAWLNARLRLFDVRSSTGRLLALVPLYERALRLKGLPIRRVELIGAAWHDTGSFFSEYLDFIIERQVAEQVMPVILDHLRGLSWDEFAVTAALPESHMVRALHPWLATHTSIRAASESIAYRAPLHAGFDAYTRTLSQSVRRHLLNHRNRLANPGILRADESRLDELLSTMHRFKRTRWGDRYSNAQPIQDFLRAIAGELLAKGKLELTALISDAAVVAVMFNARAGRTEYYLQSAFDPQRALRVSLGYLHFGYAIERAALAGIEHFDFLAGAGLRADYKRALGSHAVPLASYQAVRSTWLRALHGTRDALVGRGL